MQKNIQPIFIEFGGSWYTGHAGNHQILVVIQITLRQGYGHVTWGTACTAYESTLAVVC